jgi:hypothetical protein
VIQNLSAATLEAREPKSGRPRRSERYGVSVLTSILNAQTEADVHRIVGDTLTLTGVSNGTRRKWRAAAERRLQLLRGNRIMRALEGR